MIRRIVAYADGTDSAASRDFYVDVLGLTVAMEDPVLGLVSPANPTAQVLVLPPGRENPRPRFGLDVGDPAAVEAAHTEVVRRGLRTVYPLTAEPWGVRRFFVEDPSGTVVNVLAHEQHEEESGPGVDPPEVLTDLGEMLRTLDVAIRPESYVVATVATGTPPPAGTAAVVEEAEGTTVVLPVADAERAGLRGTPFAWLTLTVYSSLEAVGLTAAFSRALADADISCNVLAGFHHDHLLVPAADRDRAVEVLRSLRTTS